MANYSWQDRTGLLFGEEKMEAIRKAHILVVGAGGVGGYAIEMLARAGVGNLTIIDADTIHDSNRNRQVIATTSTVGKSKVEVWKERILDIAPNCNLTVHHLYIRDQITEEILDSADFTFVIDAIDTLSPKVFLIESLQRRGLPFISVMGVGSKFDPTRLKIDSMDKVRGCPLSRMVRKRLRKLGASIIFPVIYSDEFVENKSYELTDKEENKKSINGTIAYLPAVAGCYAAYYAIEKITSQVKLKPAYLQ